MSTTGFGQPPSAYFPAPPTFLLANQYAGLGTRFLAAILDLLVLILVTLLIALPFGILAATTALYGNAPAFVLALIFGPMTAILIAVWLLYFTYFESTTGQTLGKRALDIRVMDVKTGRPPSVGMAFVRSIVRIIDWLPALYILGFIIAALTSRKQRLGDLLADTVVVKA